MKTEIVREYQDPLAVKIGDNFRRGTEAYIECGKDLLLRKASLKHGEWLPWLRANAKTLGFGERAAQRFIALVSNPSLASDLWGHGTKPAPDPVAVEIGNHFREGQRLMQKVADAPEPNPWREGARRLLEQLRPDGRDDETE